MTATHVGVRSQPIHSRRLGEHELMQAYAPRPARMRSYPCACGGIVVANLNDPNVGVSDHNASPQHAAWREREGL